MSEDFRLVERVPTGEEYRALRRAVGWGDVDVAGVARGLAGSLYAVCVECEGSIVGCGRIVGDGGVYFYLQDVVVLPAFQGRGLGARIMGALMGYLDAHAGPGAFVGLMAASGVASFYEKYGFTERPADRPGMFRLWR
ncbi:MAG TPA: GNAT family N-acetyltransferase [Phycisphaerae bacterium]|nr:GNAT family N-acetyltransferase [Phycisphaerae bacterium]HNU45703.1 GNAT family N-acetyltransferase [Phycisphaerae bacterium]